MFGLTKFSTVDRGIAAVLAVALVCWAVGAHYTAQAAGLTVVTDTLSTSAPGVAANHTIQFTLPTTATTAEGVDANNDFIRLTFPAGFGGVASIVDADVDLEVNTNPDTLGSDWTASSTGQILELVSGGGRIAPDEVVEIEIGTNATDDGTGSNQITNNAATGSYELLIEIVDEATGDVVSSASTILVVVEQVTVTADVDPIFNFFVSGTSTGTVIDSETMTADTTDTEIPFGTLGAGTPGIAAQELRVVTNAVGGFAVTVFTDQQLTASNNADIDSFADGADTNTPTTWASPTGTIGSENTYGHWGLRSSDADLGTSFADNEYEFVPLFSDGPREVFDHNGPTDGFNSPIDAGYTQVMYKAEIMSFQEAADDYTATLTYVATPVF
jgi:hypothetical protein